MKASLWIITGLILITGLSAVFWFKILRHEGHRTFAEAVEREGTEDGDDRNHPPFARHL